MNSFVYNSHHSPGSYVPVIKDNRRFASITCPNCGKTTLLEQYTIKRNGEVLPKFKCSCTYERFVILLNWNPVEV